MMRWSTETRLSRQLVGLLLLLAILPYLNALTAGFTLDDEKVVRTNSVVTDGVDPIRILASPLFPGDLYRPLTVLTFALNQALAPGAALPFHAVNVALHAAVTLLVFVLARRVCGSLQLAAIAAAIFAVHPIHTEAVTSVVGRAELLAALFGLVAMLSAVYAETSSGRLARAMLYALSLFAFSAAILSKESGLTVLPLIVLLRIACRQEWLGRGLVRELQSLDWVPYALCAAVLLTLRFHVAGGVTTFAVSPLDNVLAFAPRPVRVRTAVGVLWDYFGLLTAPLVLSADYSYNQVPIANSWLDLRWLAGLGLLCAAAAGAVWARRPAVRFAVAFPFVAMLLTANLLFPIGTVKAERLLYLPSVGWVLLMAVAFDDVRRMTRHRALSTLILLLVCGAFALRTWLRNEDWKDNRTLFASAEWTAPNSAKVHNNCGSVLQQSGADEAAIGQYERALAIAPWMDLPALGIATVHEKEGRVDDAIVWYRKALKITRNHYDAHTDLCHILVANERFALATTACRDALRYYPADANLLKGLGITFMGLGETHKAISILQRSLALNPGDGELRSYLASHEGVSRQPDEEHPGEVVQ